jgi:hypothetical protein
VIVDINRRNAAAFAAIFATLPAGVAGLLTVARAETEDDTQVREAIGRYKAILAECDVILAQVDAIDGGRPPELEPNAEPQSSAPLPSFELVVNSEMTFSEWNAQCQASQAAHRGEHERKVAEWQEAKKCWEQEITIFASAPMRLTPGSAKLRPPSTASGRAVCAGCC